MFVKIKPESCGERWINTDRIIAFGYDKAAGKTVIHLDGDCSYTVTGDVTDELLRVVKT